MSSSVEKTGKTVDEAVEFALQELNIDREKADIEILEEPSKGLFGIIGNKLAKVRVTIKENYMDAARDFLYEVMSKMGIKAEIDAFEKDDAINLSIKGSDMGIIIGRRGETLDSLQYLTSLVVNKYTDTYKRVVIDIENYREKREETLIKLANRLADRVVKYKKPITLEPMNPYERRIIHATLQQNKYVETYSTGEEPNRKVIIALK